MDIPLPLSHPSFIEEALNGYHKLKWSLSSPLDVSAEEKKVNYYIVDEEINRVLEVCGIKNSSFYLFVNAQLFVRI